jgi:hypothetical protein
MSVRLSSSIKALIAGPNNIGSALPSPGKVISDKLFNRLSSKALAVGLAKDAWIVMTTAALVTVNSPAALCELYSFAATGDDSVSSRIRTAAVSGLGMSSLGNLPFRGMSRSCEKRESSASDSAG